MPLICKEDAPIFQLPGAPGVVFTGLVSPKRGSTDVSAWRVRLEPGTPGAPHRVTREEVFVAIAGEALVTMGFAFTTRVSPLPGLNIPASTPFCADASNAHSVTARNKPNMRCTLFITKPPKRWMVREPGC